MSYTTQKHLSLTQSINVFKFRLKGQFILFANPASEPEGEAHMKNEVYPRVTVPKHKQV